MVKVIIPMDKLDEVEQLQQLAISAIIKGASSYPQGDDVVYNIFLEKLDVPTALGVIALGGSDVENFPLFVEVTDILNDPVPTGIPFSTYIQNIDGEPTETPHTWQSWGVVGFPIVEREDGRLFKGTDAIGSSPTLKELVTIPAERLFRAIDLPPNAPSEV